MFWVNNWMIMFLEYCYDMKIDSIEDNDYGQFVELDY
jgi:hypothetical protein